MKVTWLDLGRDAQYPPDPAYPSGKDIQLHTGIKPKCTIQLPYPAARCGLYIVECEQCGVRLGVTTAGRHDDPRSVEIACRQFTRV